MTRRLFALMLAFTLIFGLALTARADNAASCRVLEKCGFTLAEEGVEEGRPWRYYQRG